MKDAELIYLKPELLKPYKNNSRAHPREHIEQLKNSIIEFGWRSPILIDEENNILAGHGRFLAAKELKLSSIPCVKTFGLSEIQKKAYIIADNKLTDNSQFDNLILKEELLSLKLNDYDLSVIGFGEAELNILLGENVEGLTDEDEVPQAPEEPKTKLGDIWVLGNHRLMCGDSTNIDEVDKLMHVENADMIFTDPPYGMRYGGGRAGGKTDGTMKKFGVIKGDDKRGDCLIDLVRSALSSAYARTKKGAAWYVCFTWRTYSEFEKSLHTKPNACIVWDKKSIGLGTNKGYRPQHEFIFYIDGEEWHGDKSQSDVWHITRGNTGGYAHPTQKPVELIEIALNNSSKPEDIILDVFGGSGSTLIAAEKLGRKARIMELDPKYCDVIVKRWEDFTGRKAVLEANK